MHKYWKCRNKIALQNAASLTPFTRVPRASFLSFAGSNLVAFKTFLLFGKVLAQRRQQTRSIVEIPLGASVFLKVLEPLSIQIARLSLRLAAEGP